MWFRLAVVLWALLSTASSCPQFCNCNNSIDECQSCKDGYFSWWAKDNNYYKCKWECPANCRKCLKSDNCSECNDGYYNHETDTNKNCQNRCLNNCKRCTDSNTCTECYPNFAGPQCGQCTDGFYGNYCNDACRNTCASCKSLHECISCKQGFKGTRCDICEDGKYGSQCDKDCPESCQTCSGASDCQTCKTGYYGTACRYCVRGKHGPQCDKNCPSGCNGGTCHKSNGYCYGCNGGRYGNTCTLSCALNCKDRLCDKDSGACNSCVPSYFGSHCNQICPDKCTVCSSTQSCTTCKTGHYGVTCTEECPANCKRGLCYKSSGDCREGCVDGYHSAKCDQKCPTHCVTCQSSVHCYKCEIGFKGYRCQGTCGNCKRGCKLSNGQCFDGCSDGYYGHYCSKQCKSNCKTCKTWDFACESCIDGKYGRHTNLNAFKCDKDCPKNCLNKICKPDTGNCLACDDGYTGDKCEKCPEHCQICSPPGVCTTCKADYINIDKQCTCRKDMCTTDTCDACTNPKWYVDKNSGSCCECSRNCKNRECIADNQCTNGCVAGYYGESCGRSCISYDQNCIECKSNGDQYGGCIECKKGFYPDATSACITCSGSCVNNSCSSTNGHCTDGCMVTVWGNKCTKKCPDKCWKCDRVSGDCLACSGGKYMKDCARDCSSTCSKTSTTLICEVNDGKCLHGCTNTTLHGPQCTDKCSSGCTQEECEWQTGNCLHGCKENFYGDTCATACSDKCGKVESDRRCLEKDGKCVNDCAAGFYGDRCNERCSEHCVNVTCSRDGGVCDGGCADGYVGATCIQAKRTEEPGVSGAVIGGAIGAVVAVIVIVLVLVLVIILLRRRKQRNQKENDGNTTSHGVGTGGQKAAGLDGSRTEQDGGAVYSNVGDSAIILAGSHVGSHMVPPVTSGADNDVYYNTFSARIAVEKLQYYVSNASAQGFEREFQQLPYGLKEPYDDSQKPENASKNRYKGIYPYDASRVRLTGHGSDYINACYIDGFQRDKAYIASLGPTEKTMPGFVDFWRMVWQNNVEKIVMLTNLYESGAMKCGQYWPDNGSSVTYGDVTVTCHSEDTYAEYTVRTFTVAKGPDKRSLHHIHFTAWPDKGVPDDVTGLIEFRQKVESWETKLNGPMIVHCSAGVGRTGTYIALDILTRQGQKDRAVNIYGCVMNMREQRVFMVQTKEQYHYLHQAVVHALTFDSDAIQGEQFQQRLAAMKDGHLVTQFQQLQKTCVHLSEEETEAVKANKSRDQFNRKGADIPGNLYRPRLTQQEASSSSDYINAVYINSFTRSSHYITGQTPLPNTVTDFLTLIDQYNCVCIVSMDPGQLKDKSVGVYLPGDNKSVKHGPFTVTSGMIETGPNYNFRKLTLSQLGHCGSVEKTLSHFQLTQWPDTAPTPRDAGKFVEFIKKVESSVTETDPNGRILMHCLTGAERSGLFCVVSVLIQKMEIEHQVSVVNTVRQVKSRRMLAIPNKEQFTFCHDCVDAYLKTFDIYSNFSAV